MLHRAGLFGSPVRTQRQILSDEEEEEAADVEMNLVRSWYLSIGPPHRSLPSVVESW